jgi:hypothetical protein
MTRSSVLPSIALAVAMASLFAPPVFGLMGLSAAPASHVSALVIEKADATAVAAGSAAYTRRPHMGSVAECPVVGTSAKAPPPPSLRTIVADLSSAVAVR